MEIIPLGTGKCSNFGGPHDTGVADDEGLALIQLVDLKDWWFRRLFLPPSTWDNTKGLARNLNPSALYCAMRWAYGDNGNVLPGKYGDEVRRTVILVETPGRFVFVQAADWGPNEDTGRLIDLSPGACTALGAQTDDIVSVSAII